MHQEQEADHDGTYDYTKSKEGYGRAFTVR